mmetsp:Transcript_29315/g.63155  ORF Transcript_29315/g.63155 Transcript_29315/m.63155 type:complete len:525 (+) Transcript_29315:80-1654(+)
MSSMDTIDVDKWLEEQNFNNEMLSALDDLGVKEFSDLQMVLEDEVSCAELVQKVKRVEVIRLQKLVKEKERPGKGPAGDAGVGGGTGDTFPGNIEQVVQAAVMAALRGQTQSSSSSVLVSSSAAVSSQTVAEMAAKIARLEEQCAKESSSRKRALQHHQQQEQLRATKTRKLGIAALVEQLKRNATLDLLIMLDCTSSMRCFMTSAKSQITQLVAELGNLYPDISLRLGFVGYRDHCNGRLHIVQLPFTHSVADFQTFVSAQQPIRAGGGNFADVLGGLQAAAAMQWASTTRILYHLGDQPCHGKEFNKSSNPGVPTGLSALTQLKALSGQDVLYFFGQITSCTDKMIARFNELMQTQFVDQTPLTASNMMRVITSSVTTSLSTTLSSSSRTDGHTSSCKMFKIDSVMPDWAGVKIERAVRFSVIQPSSMDALVDEADDSVVESYPHPEAVQLLVASRPFAQGAVRLAYHALELPTATGSGAGAGIKGGQSRVLKESKSAGKAHQKLERYRSYLSPQRAAAYLP